ncbi:acyltransferase family protein [Nocardioides sp.]|uniref:acyltransferase family protein n=1 Tax=Nocardioides sp. TaxID=35761 RepID=UPI003513561F
MTSTERSQHRATSSSTSGRQHLAEASAAQRSDIQGLRTIAVGAVVVNHADAAWLPGGYVGVDVFFVISGFLITSQLLRRIGAGGTAASPRRRWLRSFYAARIRRLLPMSALVLVASVVAARLLLPPTQLPTVAQDAVATSLYASNLWFAHTGTDYLANPAPSLFQHYWSLALEEQFYLFWPLLLLAAVRIGRGRRATAGVMLAVVATSFALCVVLTDTSQPWAFFTLPARAWELAVGGLVALAAQPLSRRSTPRARQLLGWAGLAGIAASVVLFSEDTTFPGTAVLLPVVSTAAVIAAAVERGSVLGSILGHRVVQWVGDRSYSIYLWHWPVLILASMRWGPLSPLPLLGLLALTMLLSALSYRLVEQPLRRSPRLAGTPRTFAFGGALTATTLAAAAVLALTVGPLTSDRTAPPLDTAEVPAELPAPSFVPRNLTPTLTGAADDLPATYADGCHLDFAATRPKRCVDGTGAGLRVALVGDSHAAQWFPALRQIVAERGGRLLSLTKSSCPVYDVPIYNTALKRPYRECDAWRPAALATVRSFAADVVVLAGFGAAYQDSASDPAAFAAAWQAGIERTIRSLPRGTQVVVLGDTPRWPEPVNDCVARRLEDPAGCALPVDRLVRPSIVGAEERATAATGARYVDTVRWICGRLCQPIAGNVLVYRDVSHITAAFASALTPQLARVLRD